MHPRISLLDELRKGGYEASLITTFNAYLPFYEEVVLRRLVNVGVRHNVLLMDAAQYSISCRDYPPNLAGRQYTLAPIKVPGAFHPKIIVLVGEKKALVAVGSHNMTLAGFGFNRELTNVVRVGANEDPSARAVVQQAWDEVEHWLQINQLSLPSQVIEMVDKVRDFAPWLNKVKSSGSEGRRIFGARPGNIDLWSQLTGSIKGGVREVSVFGAFFDKDFSFVRQIKTDLAPSKIIVAVDPATVQMPTRDNVIPGVEFVSAAGLGARKKDGETQVGYLHAKGILLKVDGGDTLLALGSANPSAPAWLAGRARSNVEIMFVSGGVEAKKTADDLGLSAISSMPVLTNEEWDQISTNYYESPAEDSSSIMRCPAVVEGDRIIVSADLVAGISDVKTSLHGANRSLIDEGASIEPDGLTCFVRYPIEKLSVANKLIVTNEDIELELLLHHHDELEAHSRTGPQRQLKNAILSLDSGSPDLELLISCLDKIIFSDVSVVESESVKKGKEASKPESEEEKEPTNLLVDVEDMKTRTPKKRLLETGDFAYLLDALIYHLRLSEDKVVENLDHFGRSEEEQIDADDPETDESPEKNLADSILLEHCNRKVTTLVSRMIKQLQSFERGEQSFQDVLVRLLGVLAVLRELRKCDNSAQWVPQGKTAVPLEQRERIFDAIMWSVFDGKFSLLHLEALGEEIENSDEISRLKGLLIWLAWDSGKAFISTKPFNESQQHFEARLFNNGMLLALAQSIRSDQIVIDEAKQSIGTLTKTELEWLKDLQTLAADCDSFIGHRASEYSDSEVESGDLAVHKTAKTSEARVVFSAGHKVRLIQLCKDKEGNPDHKTYLQGNLSYKRLSHDQRI